MKKLMKKSSRFLLGTIFILLGFVVIFGASSYADTSCLNNYTTEELQKIQTLKSVLKNNDGKFDENFIKGKLSTLNFVTTIDNSLACRGGFVNFKDFNNALRSFILSLAYRKISLEKIDNKFKNAEESLKQNLVNLIPWKFEDTTKSEQDSEIDLEIKFKKTDKTNKWEDMDINANLTVKVDGKIDQKAIKTDTNFSVDFDVKWEGKMNNHSAQKEKISAKGKLDTKIMIEDKNLWLQLNELEFNLGETNNMQWAMIAGILTEFKKKIGKKFIHIPLDELGDIDEIKDFSNNGENPFSLEKFKDVKIFNFVKYQDKNTIQINKDICNIISIDQLKKIDKKQNIKLSNDDCLEGITNINHNLLYLSKIEKVNENERKITGKNINTSFMILRDDEKIKEINIQEKDLDLKYKNDDFSFVAKNKDTGKKLFTIKGVIIPKKKIDLKLELEKNNKLNTFIGNLLLDRKGEKNHAIIQFGMIANEGFNAINGMFKLEINELVKKISSFRINTPKKENTIEIEELQAQFKK